MREKGSFRKKGDGFVVPTVKEIKAESNKIMMGEVQEILMKIEELETGFLNIKVQEEKVKFRLKQLGIGEDGKEVGEPLVKELFNGALKSVEFLKAEANIDVHNYKQLVGDLESNKRYLVGKGFSSEQLSDIINLKFDKVAWLEAETKKIKGDLA
jgi:hypothetical protein